MMDRQEIEKKVIESTSTVMKVEADKISLETRFVEDLRMKSMKAIMLTALLEDMFNAKFPMSRVMKNQTVGDAVDMVIEVLSSAS